MKTHKKILCLVSLCILAAGAVQAVPIVEWEPTVAINADSDVSLEGDLVMARNLSSTSFQDSPTVNGVEFIYSNGVVMPGVVFTGTVNFGDEIDRLDGTQVQVLLFSYNQVQVTGGTPCIFGEDLLEPGSEYLIQIFYGDDRRSYGDRSMTFQHADGSNASPGIDGTGEYLIGRFVADDTNLELTCLGIDSNRVNALNAFQIRNLTSGPVPTLSTTAGSPVSGNFTVDISFTEAVTGLEESDIVVTNGTVQASSLSGSGANWSVVIVPTANGDVSVTLPADSVTDVDSEPNPESNTLVTTYVAPGSDQPIATLSTPLAEVNRAYTVYINFTEAVTGLELSDFVISNGTLSNLAGSGASYSALVTPINTGDVTLSLPAGSVTDTDGDNLQNPASNELVRVYSGAQAKILYQDHFDNDSLAANTGGIGGGAVNRTIQAHAWTDNGDATFVVNGTTDTQRALLYSENAFQSDTGFRLTVNYTTGSIEDVGSHNLSFGLISSDTDLATYTGYNPFQADTSVYSIGANVTADGGTATRGLNFTDGSTRTTLDESGTRAQFVATESTEVTIEIGIGGYWCYRINGVYEASGVLLEGFDLTKDYHVVVYGQDDDGGGKSIQSVNLESAYAAGERAAGLRGTWASVDHDAVEQVSDFKTLDTLYARFNDGATQSGNHFVPHKLLETLALEGYDGNASPITSVVPSWGDLSLDEPENDVVHDQMIAIKAAGFKLKVYSNAEQFVGANSTAIGEFVLRWKEWCDNDPEALAFINSQPYHTHVWNSSTQEYDIGGPVNRKYMFCYAEFVLKDFALRYGHLINSWIWDSSPDITSNGDINNGVLEDQRIFQAFANAVHAGNPEIALAFNLGRSSVGYPSYPFQQPTHFDDFTFGHAFGGNNNHAVPGGTFDSNYTFIERMTETDGYVFDGGNWDWDDLIVGNFHSKLGPISWRYSNPPAWEQDDFNQWNLEAMQAGGAMTWSGATTRVDTSSLYSEAYAMLKGLDDYLAQYESPDTPNWARAYTLLPDAVTGVPYSHTLVDDIDFWDPEGDAVTLSLGAGVPGWLTIEEDTLNPGSWLLHGLPRKTTTTEYEFGLLAADASDATERWVQLTVDEPEGLYIDGDLTFDGKVNLEDIAELSTSWQLDYIMDDLLEIANNWLSGT